MKCWLHSSSEVAAPSRASVSASPGFLMWGLAPASCLGKGDMCPNIPGARQVPPSPTLPRHVLSSSTGLCCHHLLLCLLLTSWFNSKGLTMLKMIVQDFFFWPSHPTFLPQPLSHLVFCDLGSPSSAGGVECVVPTGVCLPRTSCE